MAVQDVELSRSGMKISYLRFLSDSAAGQIVILIALAAYYFPVFGGPLRHFRGGDVSTEVKVLVAVLLVLLSSPLGLAINATSWFVLSWLQVGLQRFWFNETRILRRLPFNYIREEFQVESTKDYFKLSKKNWYARSQLIKQTLHLYRPAIINSLDHVRGIRTLFRNIAFLALVLFLWSLFRGGPLSSYFWFLVLFAIPMLISALLGFHYTSHVLYRAYIVMRAAGRSSPAEEAMEREVIAILSGDFKVGNERLAE
jgi:hypothetical protein